MDLYKCSKCKEIKPKDMFHPRNDRKRGLSYHCKKCVLKSSKLRTQKRLKEVECENCKNTFKQKRKDHNYCTKECRDNLKYRKYTIYKKNFCEFCGFIPIDPCQLDVDHINGNHNDNNIENLQTLCANCHRLKTKINKEGYYKRLKK